MSGYFDFFKVQYQLGLSKDRLKMAVKKGYLIVNDTVDEYQQITGETYTA
jgi:hypothetical protein